MITPGTVKMTIEAIVLMSDPGVVKKLIAWVTHSDPGGDAAPFHERERIGFTQPHGNEADEQAADTGSRSPLAGSTELILVDGVIGRHDASGDDRLNDVDSQLDLSILARRVVVLDECDGDPGESECQDYLQEELGSDPGQERTDDRSGHCGGRQET